MKPLVIAAVLAALSLSGSADAKARVPSGVPVKVVVTDTEGTPIATAVVRHPDESDRHRVNAVDGSWEASTLYLPDGTELLFTPGMDLRLEISAPGYITQVIQYNVRKRNNKIPVELARLELQNEEIEEPVIQFGRDKPRDEGSEAPANCRETPCRRSSSRPSSQAPPTPWPGPTSPARSHRCPARTAGPAA